MSRTAQARLTAGLFIVTGLIALGASAASAWPRPGTDVAGGTCTGQGTRAPIIWVVHNHETGHTGSPATVVHVVTSPAFPTTGAGTVLPNTGDSTAQLVTTVPAAFHGPVTLSYRLSWSGTAGSDSQAGGATVKVITCPVGLPPHSSTTAPPSCSTTTTALPPCAPSSTTSTTRPVKLPPCGPPRSTTSTTAHPPRCVPPPSTTSSTAPPASMTSTTICTTSTTEGTTTSTTEATTTTTEATTTTSTTVDTSPPPPPPPSSSTSSSTSTSTSTTSSTAPPVPPASETPPVPPTEDTTPPPPDQPAFEIPGPDTTVAVASVETLPVTGSSSGPLAVAGAGLVAAGVLLVRRSNQLADV